MINIIPWAIGGFATLFYWALFIRYGIKESRIITAVYGITLLIGTSLFIWGFLEEINWVLAMVGFFSFGLYGAVITCFFTWMTLSKVDPLLQLLNITKKNSGSGFLSPSEEFKTGYVQIFFSLLSLIPAALLAIVYYHISQGSYKSLSWLFFSAGIFYPIFVAIALSSAVYYLFFHSWDTF
jgi:hypothetical protein